MKDHDLFFYCGLFINDCHSLYSYDSSIILPNIVVHISKWEIYSSIITNYNYHLFLSTLPAHRGCQVKEAETDSSSEADGLPEENSSRSDPKHNSSCHERWICLQPQRFV